MPTEHAHIVVVGDLDGVVARRQVLVDDRPGLLEVLEPGGPHPHDEVFVLGVDPLKVRAVGLLPVHTPFVFGPGDARFTCGHLGAVRIKHLIRIIEE